MLRAHICKIHDLLLAAQLALHSKVMRWIIDAKVNVDSDCHSPLPGTAQSLGVEACKQVG